MRASLRVYSPRPNIICREMENVCLKISLSSVMKVVDFSNAKIPKKAKLLPIHA
jgi:hypothetical protein